MADQGFKDVCGKESYKKDIFHMTYAGYSTTVFSEAFKRILNAESCCFSREGGYDAFRVNASWVVPANDLMPCPNDIEAIKGFGISIAKKAGGSYVSDLLAKIEELEAKVADLAASRYDELYQVVKDNLSAMGEIFSGPADLIDDGPTIITGEEGFYFTAEVDE